MTSTPLALGAMYFGTRLDDRASFALLDRFVEEGGQWIDTANCYSFWTDPSGIGGQSEEVIGRWLKANPGADVKISTKVGVQPLEAGGAVEGLSRDAVRAGLEKSVERLGGARIDRFWAHSEDLTVPIEEVGVTFGELVRDGLVGEVAICNNPTWAVERARNAALQADLPPFVGLQLRHSYLQPRPGAVIEGQDWRFGMVTPETLDYVERAGDLDLWVYTALLLGAYDRNDRDFTPAYRHEGNTSRLAALGEVARAHGVKQGQVVLAWLAGGATRMVPILGGSKVEQLEEAVAGVRLELTPEQRARLDDAA
ncbi:aldo/keto reductase [Demetria terragena]|uniref:aldo/keto reductase n=1 Tax=Demetria terragena TaxID=63959 RepID=UPI000380D61C|nr:aldo/keto reductase [Demetria terragena]